MNLYQQCKIFQPLVKNVKCMKVRFFVHGYSVVPCFGVPGFIVCRLFPLYSIVHAGR